MIEKIRVALCDDHVIVRTGLRTILTEEPDLEVIGEAATAAEGVALAVEQEPDVFVVDLGLPDASGLEVVRRIREASSATRVLVLTMHDDIDYLREAFDAGAFGYLIKDVADAELVIAIRAVAQGRKHVHPSLGAALLSERTDANEPRDAPSSDLSPRETETLRFLALGFTNQEISSKLHVSVRTIEAYRSSVQRKLGLRSRAELGEFARHAGLLE